MQRACSAVSAVENGRLTKKEVLGQNLLARIRSAERQFDLFTAQSKCVASRSQAKLN